MKEKNSLKNLLNLFLTFFKLGIFAIGGGPTMLTLLQGELVEKKKWLSNDELMEITAIAESTPGPIAINLATYLGYKRGGFFGALFSTLGVVITPFTLMFVISLFLEKFLSFEAVKYAFMGVKVGVVFLLLKVSITLIKNLKKDWFGIILFSTVTIAMVIITILAVKFSAIYFILLGAVLGLLVYGIIPKKRRDK
ncbi:MAG: chromate transporter [Bacilli bacterium]|nr:chromate transporter [Bacilli bacterium]